MGENWWSDESDDLGDQPTSQPPPWQPPSQPPSPPTHQTTPQQPIAPPPTPQQPPSPPTHQTTPQQPIAPPPSSPQGGTPDAFATQFGAGPPGSVAADANSATNAPDATAGVEGGVPTKRRRKAGRFALAAVILVAFGSGLWVVTSFMGSGGAGSPEAAVNTLADAINKQDPLLAASVLNPDELPFLTDLLSEVGNAQERIGLGKKGEPVSGTELKVSGLRLKEKSLGPRVSRVTVRSGRAELSTTTKDMPPIVREVWDDHTEKSTKGRLGLNELLPLIDTDDGYTEIELTLMVVKEGRGWYISPMLTFSDWFAQYADAQWSTGGDKAANFDDFGLSEEFDRGADSPEDAVDALADAISSGDIDSVVAALPSDQAQFGLVYADVLRDVYENEMLRSDYGTPKLPDGWFRLRSFDVEQEKGPNGTIRLVIDEADIETENSWGDKGRSRLSNLSMDNPSFDLDEPSALNRWVNESLGGSMSLIVRKVDGGWKVDPVATVLDMGVRLVRKIDKDLADSFALSLEGDAKELTVGETGRLDAGDSGLVRASFTAKPGSLYAVHVDAPNGDEDGYQLDDVSIAIGFKDRKQTSGVNSPLAFVADSESMTIAIGGVSHGLSTFDVTVAEIPVVDKKVDSEVSGNLTSPIEIHRIPLDGLRSASDGTRSLDLEGSASTAHDKYLRFGFEDSAPTANTDLDRVIWRHHLHSFALDDGEVESTNFEFDGDELYLWIEGSPGDSYRYRLTQAKRGFDGSYTTTIAVRSGAVVTREFDMGSSHTWVEVKVDWDELTDIDPRLTIEGEYADSNSRSDWTGPDYLSGSGSGTAAIRLQNYGPRDTYVTVTLEFDD